MISIMLASASAATAIAAVAMVAAQLRADRYEHDRLIWVRTRGD